MVEPKPNSYRPDSCHPDGETGEGPPELASELSHLERDGREWRARMVDVGAKDETLRIAVARASIRFPGDLAAELLAGHGPKGALEEVARTAGILAAKRTAELIPMCHTLGMDYVTIDFSVPTPDCIDLRCETACRGRTGVEMEAMTGASIAALTIYDMTKAVARGATIERTQLIEKRGGRSGHWVREGHPPSVG